MYSYYVNPHSILSLEEKLCNLHKCRGFFASVITGDYINIYIYASNSNPTTRRASKSFRCGAFGFEEQLHRDGIMLLRKRTCGLVS